MTTRPALRVSIPSVLVSLASLVLASLAWTAPAASAAAPTWAGPQVVASGGAPGHPRIDVAGDGTATVVWVDGLSVRASTRPPAGTWSAADTLYTATVGAGQVDVAVNTRGDAAAVWTASAPACSGCAGQVSVVMASTRTAGGGWTPAVRLSDTERSAADLRLVIDDRGHVTVAWARATADNSSRQVQTRSFAGSWSSTVTVESRAALNGNLDLATGPRGPAALAWVGLSATTYGTTRVALRGEDGAWGPSAELSPQYPSTQGVAVAVSDGGRPTVTWVEWLSGRVWLRARTWSGTAWAAPETLTSATDNVFFTELMTTATADGRMMAVYVSAQAVQAVVWAPGDTGSGAVPVRVGTSTFAYDLVRGGGGDIAVQVLGDHPVATWTAHAGWIVAPPSTAGFGSITVDGDGTVVHASRVLGASPQVEVRVLDRGGPAVSTTVPGSAVAGQRVALSSVVRDVWSGPSTARWSFGDGSAPADGASTTHVWTAPGSYEVTVTGTDAVGNTTTARRSIVVGDAPTTGDQPPAPDATPAPSPSAPASPAPASPAPTAQPATRPGIGEAVLSRRVLTLGGTGQAARSRLSFTLSAAAEVEVALRRSGGGVRASQLRGLAAGAHRVVVRPRFAGTRLTPGRYVVTLTASNAAGTSDPVRLRLRVRR